MGMNKFILETGPGLSSKIERDGAEYLYLPQGREWDSAFLNMVPVLVSIEAIYADSTCFFTSRTEHG